jgi:hypothetical protein
MKQKQIEGRFHVIDSFAIKKRNEFYLIGTVAEGQVQEQWFANIPLNKSLSLTVRISQIEEIEMTNGGGTYKLLIIRDDVDNDPNFLMLMLGLNIGSELLDITIEGGD